MTMETDPDKINDPQRQLDASIFNEGQGYAARNARSKAENKGRAEARTRIKDLGMNPNAFATAVGLVKRLTPSELIDWQRDFDASIKVLSQKQAELFPEEQAAALKREAVKLAKNAPVVPPASATDNNPRSNPDAGGAKPQTGDPEKPWPDDVAVATAPPNPPNEAEEGDAALRAAMPATTAASKPRAQSVIAKEKLDAAMSPGGKVN